MRYGLRAAGLGATVLLAMSAPHTAALAQNGYAYLFWPFFAPAPAAVPLPAPPPRLAAKDAREAEIRSSRGVADLRYAPAVVETPHPGYGSQFFLLGVGY